MRKHFRLIAVLLVLMMALALFGCDKKESPAETVSPAATGDESSPADDTTPVTPADTGESAAPEASDEPEEQKLLVMGTNAEFPPYEFYEGGKVVGIDAEIAAAIAEKLGMTLRIDDMDFDSVIPAIVSGKIDMGMAGMTVTEERLQSINFSTSYATGVQVVIVPEGSAITSVDDLFADGANHNVGVQEATTGDLYATWDIEDEGLGTISRYKKGADAVMALISGKLDCVIIDNEPAKAFVAMNPGLVILDTEYIIEEYAIAISKSNTELLAQIDNALVELIADGTVQSIIDKYITND